MLSKFDDYPIHQTPEPIAHVASSDRNAYDRYWFNGYAEDLTRTITLGSATGRQRRVLEDVGAAQDAGFAGHLVKPVDLQALEKLIAGGAPAA